MNMTLPEGREFLNGLMDHLKGKSIRCQLILGVPFIHLAEAENVSEVGIKLAAQNCSEHSDGAYTGEISAAMIQSTGTNYVILGHSERRQYYGDSDAVIHQKIREALSKGLRPVFCVGEQLSERQSGNQEQVVHVQLENGLEGIPASDMEKIIIAYEPVWAIGTGLTASPEEAQKVHAFIRALVSERDINAANMLRILYGGSVKPDNALSLFGQKDIDGGLIGGASLDAKAFVSICQKA